jgi:hypothetical protein
MEHDLTAARPASSCPTVRGDITRGWESLVKRCKPLSFFDHFSKLLPFNQSARHSGVESNLKASCIGEADVENWPAPRRSAPK